MERKKLTFFCAAAACFWLFALALGTAEGYGWHSLRGGGVAAASAAQTAAEAEPGTGAEGQKTLPVLLPLTVPESGKETALPAAADPAPELPCRAAILIDQDTGTVLFEKNADERVPIASITKVMTLLLTFEALHEGKVSLDQVVPVSTHAAEMGGSQIWLEPGEKLTLHEMLKAICVSSANDAAVAVAELVGGSEPVFVERMNAKAAALGMTNTTFRNACGLDREGHLSSARDVSIMSRAILSTCPEVLQYTGIWIDTLRGGATQLVNTNKLLRRYSGITGLKTGTTGGAGVCLTASAERDGLRLIGVVLGSPSSAERFEAATNLLDYGFAHFEAAPLPIPELVPLRAAVRGSAEEEVPLDYGSLPATLLLPRESRGELNTVITLPETIQAPVRRGDTVGKAAVTAGEQVLGEYEIRAAADAPQLTLPEALGLLLRNAAGW